MQYIDLHVHTTASDGTCTPSEVMKIGERIGLKAIAITDHDTLKGLDEVGKTSKKSPIEVVSGIEISSEWEGTEIHLLAYLLDNISDDLRDTIKKLKLSRESRNEGIAYLLNRDGVQVSIEKLRSESRTRIIGRPYFARLLIDKGLAKEIPEAFQKYLTPGKPYFVKRVFPDVKSCLSALRNSGGVPVLAHPIKYNFSNEKLLDCISELKNNGLCGIECMYSGYSKEQVEYLTEIAKKFNLCRTGGSDFHGKNKPDIRLGYGYGELRVPYEYLASLKDAKQKYG